jgi:mono/diheme cytochrome c family protein
VWTNPQASGIRPEQWPFQIATIRQLAPVETRFPALLPARAAEHDPVRQGFALFQQNCLACHRLNGAGDAQFGPDLNLPHNPTEYFQPAFLRQYIRDPQSLRQWPQARMPGFAEGAERAGAGCVAGLSGAYGRAQRPLAPTVSGLRGQAREKQPFSGDRPFCLTPQPSTSPP